MEVINGEHEDEISQEFRLYTENKKRIEIINDFLDGTQGHRIKNEFLF